MLNFIYYPISWLLKIWHNIINVVLPSNSGLNWMISIVLLVVTIRLLLLWPTIKQTRTMRQMQEMQPKIKAVQKKYKNDRQRQGQEIQKLQRENGFNPLLGCLPMLIQIPVFIGLFHVLRVIGTEGSDNYAFSDSEVQDFTEAHLFGAPIGATISQSTDTLQGLFGEHSYQWAVVAVAIPLMIISAGAMHFNARVSIARQTEAAASQPQAAIMNRVMLWIFPIGILATGFLWTVGLLMYTTTNNVWSLVQQILIYRKMDGEEMLKKELKEAVRADLAPRPGQRPGHTSKLGSIAVVDSDEDVDSEDDATVSTPSASGSKPKAQPGAGSRPAGQSARRASGSRKNKKKKKRK